MPGARSLNVVTTMLIAATVDEMPLKISPKRVEVDVHASVVLLERERHVVEPARIRRRVHEEARVHEDAGAEEQPVAQRVQARERHVARADHQRQQVVPERAGRHRDDEEEDHRDAVHREKLVVGLRPEHVLVRLRELRAHQERLCAARARRTSASSRSREGRCACGRRSSATRARRAAGARRVRAGRHARVRER